MDNVILKKAEDELDTEKFRFRGSIYLDLDVESDDLEKAREEAKKQIEEYAEQIPNSYVGGVAKYNPQNLLNPLDKEI